MCSNPNHKHKPNLLYFIDYHHEMLRQAMPLVSFPLSKEDKQIIADMKYSIQKKQLKKVKAPWKSAAGMAANQWGIPKRIFLYCPEGDTEKNLEAVINPSYVPLNAQGTSEPPFEEYTIWESCFSVPLATGHIKRFLHILVQYQNEKGEPILKKLSGYHAQVFQHETDHLNGFLYDDPRANKCLEKKNFATVEEVNEFYKSIYGS